VIYFTNKGASHPNSHPTSDYAVGLGGMNACRDGEEVVDFPDRKERRATGRDGRQRITKPLHCHCANPACSLNYNGYLNARSSATAVTSEIATQRLISARHTPT
jgi:hypothetical protein